ncbi:MAG: chromosome segregation protein SMC [Candidatus Woesearchaeota archaeon]
MTRINKIVCHGFKSFAKRTELLFNGKFNCIIGPNGSGKSNVLDALCFVLGKSSAKSLRAEKASNLIYNGGKLKNPSKWGEVSIFFDNSKKTFPTPEREVKISRIVRQSGQSKYMINDQTRTRNQILDLLSLGKIDPNGYNIILQGDIVRFVEMPTTQRRELIDEISGISVYEDKKHKAILELGKVDKKLEEADIVLTERGAYLKELRKDRDQAIKYKSMNDRIKENKASYLKIRIDKREKIKNSLNKRLDDYREKLKAINLKIDTLKNDISTKKNEIEDLAREVQEKSQGGEDSITKEAEKLKIDLTRKTSRIESLKNEISKIIQRKQELVNSKSDTKEKINELEEKKKELLESKSSEEKEKLELDQKIKKFKEKHKLDAAGEIEQDLEVIDKKIDDLQKDVLSFRESQQNLLREKDRIELQINNVEEKIDKISEVEKEHKQQLDDLKIMRDDFKKSTLELSKKLNEDSEMAGKIAQSRKLMMRSIEELTKLEAKDMSIKETAQVNMAVKKIQEQKEQSRIPGIYGTISELGNVPSKFSLSLEVAAGPRINSIIVENDSVAARCINYLKSNRLGTATFLPLNKIKGKEKEMDFSALLKSKGVHGSALDLIEFDPRFSNAFSYVFQNTLVVDNIDTARKLGIGKAKMVTLDGDVAEISGAMQGGFRLKRKGPSFREKGFSQDIINLNESILNLKQDIKTLEKEREDNEKIISELREKKSGLEGEIIKNEKSLHLKDGDIEVDKKQKVSLSEELKIVDKKIGELQNKISEKNTELMREKTAKQDLKSKISQLRNPALIAELNTFEEKRSEINEALIHLNNDIKNIENENANIHKPELEKIEKIIKQHDKEQVEFNEEIKELQAKIKNISVMLKEKEEAASRINKKFRELFSKRGLINEEISKKELILNKKQDESRNEEIQINTVSLEMAKVNSELAGLNEEFEQYRGINLSLNKTEEEYKSEIQKFEKMLTQVGSVNMKALEIYDHVEVEFNKLNDKKKTLITEKNDVVKMMDEIEGKKKEIFMESLDMVNSNFQRIFDELSSKGQATLELEDTENPFEAGLNIKVKITTNKFLDIKSLSGGEKTMTALAFIFAIQEHDPASFYVLDEVDAALDKRNSSKLGKLVKKYTDKAQYIMISHNDQVVSEADNLYGISMNEHGVSKVVSIKL